MRTDTLADVLTAIRNAISQKHEKVDLPASRLSEGVLKVLRDEGYVGNYKHVEELGRPRLRVFLKYTLEKAPVLMGLKRVSRPGLRIYRGVRELPRVQGGLGTAIVSTPMGILSDRGARKAGVGGEVLAYAW